MKNLKKILIVFAAIFLLAAGCSKGNDQSVSKSVDQSASQATPTPSSVATTPKGMTQTKDNAGRPDYTPGFVVVTQTVEGSSLDQPYTKIKDGATAYDLLSSAHKVESKSYSGIGEFVESIDGIKPDSQHFWEFILNGKSSNVGASSYTLKDGDKIDWKLAKISSSGQ